MKLQGVKGGKTIAQILRCAPTLTYLNIENNQLKRDGIFKIAESIEGNSSLRELNLVSCGMGAEGAKEISRALRNNATLLSLQIGHNNIKADGALAFAEHLKNNTRLIILDLAFNTLDGTVVSPISESLLHRNNACLSYLSFADNKQLGKDGGPYLGIMLKTTFTLKSLNLRGCGINGTTGCEIARGLSVNNSLTELDLSSNGLGIKGGRSILDSIRVNKTLTFLSIHSNNLSDKLEEQFKQISNIKVILSASEDKTERQEYQEHKEVSQVDNRPFTVSPVGQSENDVTTSSPMESVTDTEPIAILQMVAEKNSDGYFGNITFDMGSCSSLNDLPEKLEKALDYSKAEGNYPRVIESAGHHLAVPVEFQDYHFRGKQVRVEETIAAQGLKELLESALPPIASPNTPPKKRRQL
jgi:hypothetical protein